nr:hypothetical protein Iba_chr12bCG16420 [Ipomoea batatas]
MADAVSPQMTSGLALLTSLILPPSRIPATAPSRMALPPNSVLFNEQVRGPRRGTGKICIGESGSDLGEMGGGDSGSEKGCEGLVGNVQYGGGTSEGVRGSRRRWSFFTAYGGISNLFYSVVFHPGSPV